MLDQQLPSPLKSLIVQVSMIAGSSKTVIEAWKVAKSEECDKSAKIITGVYSKLGNLVTLWFETAIYQQNFVLLFPWYR